MLVTHVAATFSDPKCDSWARTSHENVSVIRVDDICLGSLGSLVGNYLYGNLLTLTESREDRAELWVSHIKSLGGNELGKVFEIREDFKNINLKNVKK